MIVDLLNGMLAAKKEILQRMAEDGDMLPETAGQLLAYKVFDPPPKIDLSQSPPNSTKSMT